MTALPPLPVPYPYLRTGYLHAPALPQHIGTHINLAAADLDDAIRNGLDFITIASGSGRSISPEALDVLTACEREGVPTILHATDRDDLESPTAAVVSHIATPNPDLFEHEVLPRAGPERAHLIGQPIDPHATLLESPDDPESNSPAAIARRRTLLATETPAAHAERLLTLLNIPTAPQTLVTVVLVARTAQHLAHHERNLRRQTHSRIDPLLVIDPLYENEARRAVNNWKHPPRLVVSNPRSTLADRLNLGIQHAHGDVVAIFEETMAYGPYHLTDLIHALTYSGAHLVGKATWFEYDATSGATTLKYPGKQRAFGHAVAAGSIVMHRASAQALGFVRRAAGINWPIGDRVLEAGGTIYSAHPYDTATLRRGQLPADFPHEPVVPAAFPFSKRGVPEQQTSTST